MPLTPLLIRLLAYPRFALDKFEIDALLAMDFGSVIETTVNYSRRLGLQESIEGLCCCLVAE